MSFGGGILRGLVETGRNFIGSYYQSERLTTVQYPEEKLIPQENARTVPMLIYDGADPEAGLRCTACTICEQECPPKCIHIVKDVNKKPDFLGKMQLHPKEFDIDISVCMGCGVCVEVCPFDSIKMDSDFSLTTDDRGKMVRGKPQLARPNTYFQRVHPAEAAAIDAARAEEQRKAAAKKAAAPAPAAVAC